MMLERRQIKGFFKFGIFWMLMQSCIAFSETATDKLTTHSEEFRKEIITVTPGVYVAVGYGASNATLIEGEDGVIIVDTLDSTQAAETVLAEFRKITSKPVKAIIYTHSHRDHVSGSKVFAADSDPQIYAREPFSDMLGPKSVRQILGVRAKRQFGIGLPPEELISIGIGPADRPKKGLGAGYLPPTDSFTSERLELTLAGTPIVLVAAPGETDDQLFVWLPENKILLCGDNYYKAFPNLYAIRGTPYRDVSQWADSLDKMVKMAPDHLIPAHTRPVSGASAVQDVLSGYRDAIRYVLNATLEGMNRGLTPGELVQEVNLPEHLAQKPYLQEFYGTVAWSVRSIYAGHLGWFDGNATNLYPLSSKDEAQRIAELAGGEKVLLKRARKALSKKDYQWAAKLADYLIALGSSVPAAKALKAESLSALAIQQVNANARNYYLSSAQELRNEARLANKH